MAEVLKIFSYVAFRIVLRVTITIIAVSIILFIINLEFNNNYAVNYKLTDYSRKRIDLRNDKYFILKNAISSNKIFEYDDGVTLTTYCTQNDLNFIKELVVRWNGPISVSVYAPKDDYYKVIDSIAYLRNCLDHHLVKDLVSFHIVFDVQHVPNKVSFFLLIVSYCKA